MAAVGATHPTAPVLDRNLFATESWFEELIETLETLRVSEAIS
jgi:hypothetical protein